MIDALKETFLQIEQNRCLETLLDEKFEIYDCEEEKRCYICETDGHFQVLNPNKKEVSFLAVDKCLFFDDDTFQKCDCIVFDSETICFIEIKECKPKRRKGHKKSAEKQLKSTIEIFKTKLTIDKKIEAYLCVGCSATRPSRTASSKNAQAEFLMQLNTMLFDGCQKEFI